MNVVSQCFSLVIEEYDKANDKHYSIKDLENYLSSNECIRFYALILHNKDINELGEKVRDHYHCVIWLTRPYSKQTILMDFVKNLQCNKVCVSIRLGDIVESTIYLNHGEEDNKYIYSTLDIITNDITNLNSILSKQTCLYFTSIDYLISLVQKCSTKSEIYSILGLKESKLYRSIICDLWLEKDRYKGVI